MSRRRLTPTERGEARCPVCGITNGDEEAFHFACAAEAYAKGRASILTDVCEWLKHPDNHRDTDWSMAADQLEDHFDSPQDTPAHTETRIGGTGPNSTKLCDECGRMPCTCDPAHPETEAQEGDDGG